MIEKKDISFKNILKQSKKFLGNLPSKFYRLGKQTHNTLISIGRTSVKVYDRGLAPFFTGLFHIVAKTCKFVGHILDKTLDIIVYPFVKTYAAIKVIALGLHHSKGQKIPRRALTVGHFFGAGLKNNKKFFSTIVNYALPVVGVFIFVVTVNFANTRTFAVNVLYNDSTLGYVKSEEVVEKAKKIVQGRMIYTAEDEKIEIKPTYSVNMIENENVLSEYQLAEAIIGLSGDEMIQAEGLYIDEQFYGAVQEEGQIDSTLQFILDSHSTGQEDEEIAFINDVKVVPGLYVAENIVQKDEVINLLTSEKKQEEYYTTAQNETILDIVQNAQRDEGTVRALNPELAEIGSEKKLAEGTQVLLAPSQAFLPVQVTKTITYAETSGYETVKEESADLPKGTEKITQKGVDGENKVTAKVTFLDNIEIEREIVSTEVVSEPTAKIISVGTKEFSQGEMSTGSGQSDVGFIWPMSGYVSSEAGARWGTTHKGMDIARYGGAMGAPIYAAAPGTVVFAGWSGGYGKMVKVDHGNGLATWYAHNSEIFVNVGDTVAQGVNISAAGATGQVTGPHLHFEVRVNGVPQDPRNYLP